MLLKKNFVYSIGMVIFQIFLGCSYDGDSPEICVQQYPSGEESSEKIVAGIKDVLQRSLFEFEYEFETDEYFLKTTFNNYSILLDVSTRNLSEWRKGDEIIIPFTVYKDNSALGEESVMFSIQNTREGGILLSFDDYFDCWNTYLQSFVDYDIKATFFCFGDYSRFGAFATKAQNAGLEVGYHTLNHTALTMCDTKEECIAQTITPLATLRDKYVYLDSFAFPNGAWLPYNMELLLEYYKILRLFDNHFRLYSIDDIAEKRIIFSQSIDKNKFEDESDFKDKMIKRMVLAKITGKIYPCTTHYILTNEGEISSDAYTISKENLIWLFETVNSLNCKTYCYKDIYPYMY